MASYGDDYSQNDCNRPRRSDPRSVAYLRSLPLDEGSAEHEIATYLEAQRHRHAGGTRANKNDDDNADATAGQHEDEEVEYPQSLAAAHAALAEIEKELASLSCDEHGSQIIETIARVTSSPSMGRSDRAARRMLAGLAGYHLHLACHRFGSHVVQTVLGCAAAAGFGEETDAKEAAKWLAEEVDDEGDGGHDDEDLPSVTELVLAAADELLPHARELAVHVCGSHVLRTLLCVLGGVELVSSRGDAGSGRLQLGGSRRGKAKDPKAKNKKKKKRRNPQMEESEAAAGGGWGVGNDLMQPIACSRVDTVSAGVKDALRSAIATLTGNIDGRVQSGGPSELQKLACHPSAGPLLGVLLRVLTHSSLSVDAGKKASKKQEADANSSMSDHRLGIVPPEPTFTPESSASSFVKAILCWDDQVGDVTKQPYAGDVIFGLSGEQRGSHLLETILRSSDDGFFDEICRAGRFDDAAVFREYAEHNVSNFVIQSLFVTVRSRQQADKLLNCLEPLVSSGYVLNKSNRRGGLLWRASEMCVKYDVGQDGLLHAIRCGFTALAEKNEESGHNKGTGDGVDAKEETDGKKIRHKKRKREEEEALLSIQKCVPLLVGLKAPEKEGGRAALDVAGARTVYHLLHFPPKLCRDTLDGITTGFCAQELEWIANDGLGSRCIMDAITDGKNEKKQRAHRQLLEKLSGRWVALSVERVGHHLVQNLFGALKSLDDKATLTCELARGINRLGGNAMGRKVMATCAVKEFMEGEDIWKEEVRRQARKEEILKELVEDVIDADAFESKGEGEDGTDEDINNDDGDDDDDDDDDEKPSGKKKRKRKKKKKKTEK